MEPTVEEQFGADVPDRTTLTLPLVDINHAVSGVGPEKGPEKGPAKGGKWVVDKEYIQ